MPARKILVTASDRRARVALQRSNAEDMKAFYLKHESRMQDLHNALFGDLAAIADPVERWAAVRATADMLNQIHHDLFAIRAGIVQEMRHRQKMAIAPTRAVTAEEQGITDVLGIKRARVMQLLAGRSTSKKATAKKTTAKKTTAKKATAKKTTAKKTTAKKTTAKKATAKKATAKKATETRD